MPRTSQYKSFFPLCLLVLQRAGNLPSKTYTAGPFFPILLPFLPLGPWTVGTIIPDHENGGHDYSWRSKKVQKA